MSFCKDCVTGAFHEGTPTGRVETVHGLPCYIADPSSREPKGIVVIVPDAFGWEFNNNRILADNYANKGGFRVLLPDFMNGTAYPTSGLKSFDSADDENTSWVRKIPSFLRLIPTFGSFLYINRGAVCGPRVLNFIRALRASTSLPIGAAGFCWGGRHVVILASNQKKAADGRSSLIDCGFIAHPTSTELGACDKDFMIPPESATQCEKTLQSKKSAFDTEFVAYEGVKHGFAVRAAPNDVKAKKAGEDAEAQAITWFSEQFSKYK